MPSGASLALGAGGAHADSNIAGKKVDLRADLDGHLAHRRLGAPHEASMRRSTATRVDVRDAAFNTGAMSELLAKAISEKPDVLVVHNPTVQLLARQIKQAESQGIKVLQINLQSNQPSTAFVGANWERIGREIAQDIVKECGAGSGKSGEVAIIPGQLTAADSVIMNEAAFKVFAAHPEIKVVSNQASDWEPEKARQITATVLQQHPNLCAIFGHWDVHTMGAGKAVKDAASRRQGHRLRDRRRRRQNLPGGRGQNTRPGLELRCRRPGPRRRHDDRHPAAGRGGRRPFDAEDRVADEDHQGRSDL